MSAVKDMVKKWLREQLLQLVNVQRSTYSTSSVADPVREADVVVHTWAGVLIHIHLIDEVVKPPRIKRILESATSTGIVTMFILDAALLPKQGERVPMDRWFVNFQSLANDRAYTYRLENGVPVIRPVKFTPMNRTDVETRYGAKMPVTQIRYYRSTVKHNLLKGYWLLGDFETEVSIKNPGFRPVDYTRYFHQNEGTQTNPNPSGNPNPAQENARKTAHETKLPAPKTRLELSYALLGLPKEATREDVKAAFRKMAFELHPDVSELPKAEAEARFKALSEAYEIIKSTNAW